MDHSTKMMQCCSVAPTPTTTLASCSTMTNDDNNSKNATLVLREARSLFTKVGAAAIMGNIDVETRGSFDYQQKHYYGGPGYGLFQMEQAMQADYKNWLAKEYLKDSAKSQLKYIKNEITNGSYIGAGNARIIRESFERHDVDQATREFCERLERPLVSHMERRIEAARKFYRSQ